VQLKNLNEFMGIYFVVNSGGDTDASIDKFNAWFAENDDLPIDEQHANLDACPIQPSIRVETKKSVHAYWLTDGECSADDWRDMQCRLIAYFSGDVKIKNPSRVMRVPYFNHLSIAENGAVLRKRVTIARFEPEKRFSLETMQSVFPIPSTAQKSEYASGLYENWDALNKEIRARILAHPTCHLRGEWAKMNAVCHGGKSESGLALNVASGAYFCQREPACSSSEIAVALGLPGKPNGIRISGQMRSVSHDGELVTEQPKPRGRIYQAKDLKEKLFALYEKGRLAGEHPGWDTFAEYYTVARKQFTIVTGIPSHGKSSWLDNLLVNLAHRSKWKFAICSLENLPVENHLSCLIEIALQKPFNKGERDRMTRAELEEAVEWVHERFYFVIPDENDCTIANLIEMVDDLSVDGVVIDPMNEFEHRRPAMMSETEYVSYTLSKMRRKARDKDQHWWLVAHPTKLVKDKEGNYPVPTLYDISGSAHYRNKADMGVVVWRDTLKEDTPTRVYVQKVRFRWCGKLGFCDFYYDVATGKYHESSVFARYTNGQAYESDREYEEWTNH
jgi:hypothetical protein